MRTNVTDSYAQESTQELQEALLQQVIENSSILKYTQEDYDAARERVNSIYMSYLDIFGMNDLDDVYEFLDMTKEDVEEEIQSSLYRTLTQKMNTKTVSVIIWNKPAQSPRKNCWKLTAKRKSAQRF